MTDTQSVFVIDDDPEMRLTLAAYLRAAKIDVKVFDTALAFLAEYHGSLSGCLIVDIKMPEMSGLDLQAALNSAGSTMPVIVVSGGAQVMEAVRAVKQGSFEFIEKPYAPEYLLEKVREALKLDLLERPRHLKRIELRAQIQSLSPRERKVLGLVVLGRQSKAIANTLGVTVSTVDNHRSNIMRKLKAETTADLTRLAVLADPSLALW